VHDEVATIAPSPAVVARLFAMNLGVWREGAWAQASLDPTDLDRLDRELRTMIGEPPPTGAIVWRHRQVAYDRG
jgi:hypothetical protein